MVAGWELLLHATRWWFPGNKATTLIEMLRLRPMRALLSMTTILLPVVYQDCQLL